MSCSLRNWLRLREKEISRIGGENISTVVLFVNGTRRWFQSQHEDWQFYGKLSGEAHRYVSQLCYEHGIKTLIQPLLGHDLLARGPEYVRMALEALEAMESDVYRAWFAREEIQVCFYGDWKATFMKGGFGETAEKLFRLMRETQRFSRHRLLIGLFADEGLDRISGIASEARDGCELLRRYYGVDVAPINVVIGSGQPAIWDIPLLDINKASIYFMQAPTFCLTEGKLRRILYDHLFLRRNDDELHTNLKGEIWKRYSVVGLGRRTRQGWVAT